jgi:uncharacterized membrane protein YeaQ/YmgE (transglycosylase-associated protein family)
MAATLFANQPRVVVLCLAHQALRGLNIYSMIVVVVGSIVVLLIYNAPTGRRRA